MNRTVRNCFFLWLALLCLCAAPASAQIAPREITVGSAGATIHAAPDAGSQVIESPSVGSVYEVVKKAGEWYEVKLPSRMGMVITGFIHEKFLEKPAAEPRKETVSPPPPPSPRQASTAKRGYISLGGLYQRQKGYEYDWIFPYYETNFVIYDAMDGHGAFGFQAGGGYFVLDNLAIDLGMSYSFASPEGLYGVDLPVDTLSSVHADAPVEHAFGETIISLGLSYYLLSEGQARPYIGGGLSYIHSKMELVEDFAFDYVSQLEIGDPKLTEESINSVGFYGRAGVDIVVSESIHLFGEGRYAIAQKKEVPHPMTSPYYDDEIVEIDLGGFSALFGVKIRF